MGLRDCLCIQTEYFSILLQHWREVANSPQNIGTTAYLYMLQTPESRISIDSSCQPTFQDLHNPNYLHICFCNFHYWMNAYFVDRMINRVDQWSMCSAVPLGTGMRMRMKMMMSSKSEKLWMLLKISVHFLRVCWRPKNLVMEVVQLFVVGSCIREDVWSACRRHHLFLLLFGEEWSDEHFIGTVDMAYHDDCCLLACDTCRLVEGYSCIRGSSQISKLVPILHSTTTRNTAIVDSRDCESLRYHMAYQISSYMS